MNLLFIHQNFPGQYRHLAAHFAADPAHRVVAIGDRDNMAGRAPPPGVRLIVYPSRKDGSESTHPYVRQHEAAVRRGQQVARVLLELRKEGFVPDVICAHTAWGEALFAKDVMPESRLLGYFEFFYRGAGSDLGFDPEFGSATLDEQCRVRIKNTTMLVSLAAADAGVAPTAWQQAQFPAEFRPKIAVVHEGVDTDLVCPDPADTLTLPDGSVLKAGDEVLTFVVRNLEPYRGFHVFMRALPAILARRPHARVVIVGGDNVSYGLARADGKTYRQVLLEEVGAALDLTRVHFLGWIPYRRFLSVLRVSAAHVYLTYPFVLSWSMLEAMAAGCLVIGSRTPPVEEVIEDGVNGWLTDFFDHRALAERACAALEARAAQGGVRAAARRTIVERYDLKRVCLPQQVALVGRLADARPG